MVRPTLCRPVAPWLATALIAPWFVATGPALATARDRCVHPADRTIAEVQGPGEASPIPTGTEVTVDGVVTADHRLGGYRGVYVQTEGSGGSRPVAAGTASDGLFVHLGSHAAMFPTLAIGDLVQVGGAVREVAGLTELEVRRQGDVSVCAVGIALPAAAPLALPLDDAARESVEGMLVRPASEATVSDVYELAHLGEVALAAGAHRSFVPTDQLRPRSPEALAARQTNSADRIVLDDGRSGSLPAAHLAPPYMTRAAPLRVGDHVARFGPSVLSYGRHEWWLEPTIPLGPDTPGAPRTTFTRRNRRTAGPADVGGDLRVASFNLHNYFVHFGGLARGAPDAAALAKQQVKLVATITALDADVVALAEVENSVRFEPDHPQMALERLVAALNAAEGDATWDYVRTPAELPAPGAQDVITNAIVYEPGAVRPVGPSRSINDERIWFDAREPIAQTFTAGTTTFTAVANHFKSKSNAGRPTGDNADLGDGQGAYNGDRVREAASLVRFLADLQAETGQRDVVLLGDFNAYGREDPLQALQDAGFTDVASGRTGDRRSYVFAGESGSLDHVLASPALAAKVAGADIWEADAVESPAFGYDGDPDLYAPGPFRASDHDPVVVGLDAHAGIAVRPPCLAGRGTPGPCVSLTPTT
ncbi:MAG: 5-nucleotidase protein [Acidimicrobiales bacterium]|nr:5-nucleotidase protein [Acidimicrobiales bacterium]